MSSKTASGKDDAALRIAWRYGQQQQQQPAPSNVTSAKSLQPNYFVMNKLMSKEEIYSSSNVSTFDLDVSQLSNSTNANELYSKLAAKISEHIDSLNLNITKTKQYTNVLRIGKETK